MFYYNTFWSAISAAISKLLKFILCFFQSVFSPLGSPKVTCQPSSACQSIPPRSPPAGTHTEFHPAIPFKPDINHRNPGTSGVVGSCANHKGWSAWGTLPALPAAVAPAQGSVTFRNQSSTWKQLKSKNTDAAPAGPLPESPKKLCPTHPNRHEPSGYPSCWVKGHHPPTLWNNHNTGDRDNPLVLFCTGIH